MGGFVCRTCRKAPLQLRDRFRQPYMESTYNAGHVIIDERYMFQQPTRNTQLPTHASSNTVVSNKIPVYCATAFTRNSPVVGVGRRIFMGRGMCLIVDNDGNREHINSFPEAECFKRVSSRTQRKVGVQKHSLVFGWI